MPTPHPTTLFPTTHVCRPAPDHPSPTPNSFPQPSPTPDISIAGTTPICCAPTRALRSELSLRSTAPFAVHHSMLEACFQYRAHLLLTNLLPRLKNSFPQPSSTPDITNAGTAPFCCAPIRALRPELPLRSTAPFGLHPFCYSHSKAGTPTPNFTHSGLPQEQQLTLEIAEHQSYIGMPSTELNEAPPQN